MMVPTIHLNGNRGDQLIEELCDVRQKIEDAHKALRSADYIHGRNWYPQGDEAIRQAREEHESRLQRIASVALEIYELTEKIWEVTHK